jgi:hypothetical protein
MPCSLLQQIRIGAALFNAHHKHDTKPQDKHTIMKTRQLIEEASIQTTFTTIGEMIATRIATTYHAIRNLARNILIPIQEGETDARTTCSKKLS